MGEGQSQRKTQNCVSVGFFRGADPTASVCYEEVYYKELAHVIVEPEIPQVFSGQARRADGSSPKASRLKTQKEPMLQSRSEGRTCRVPWLEQSGGHLHFLSSSVLTTSSVDGRRPTCFRKSDLLCSVHRFKCYSHPETPTERHQNNVRPSVQVPHGPGRFPWKADHHKLTRRSEGEWVLQLPTIHMVQ